MKVKIQAIILNKQSSQGTGKNPMSRSTKTGHTQSNMELKKGNKDSRAKMECWGRV